MEGDGYGSFQQPGTTEEEDGVPFGEEPPKRPNINPCLWVFHLIEAFNVVVACLLTMTQLLPFFFVRARDWSHKLGLSSMILRIYISIFCVLVVVTEFSTPISIIRESPVLQNYMSRGFLYSFVGIISVQEANNERVQAMFSPSDSPVHVLWLAIFMSITSWMMIGAGLLYLVMGMLCLKGIRDRMQEKESDDWRIYRQERTDWKKKERAKSRE